MTMQLWSNEQLAARMKEIGDEFTKLYAERQAIYDEQGRRTGLVGHILSEVRPYGWKGKTRKTTFVVDSVRDGVARGHILRKDGKPGVYQASIYGVMKKLAEGQAKDEGKYHDPD